MSGDGGGELVDMANRWHGTLAFEGQETTDGRMITPGALTWDLINRPLMVRDAEQGLRIVGLVESLEREGDAIVASGVVDCAPGTLAVALTVGEVQIHRDSEERLVFDAACAMELVVNRASWPGAEIVVSEAGEDGRAE